MKLATLVLAAIAAFAADPSFNPRSSATLPGGWDSSFLFEAHAGALRLHGPLLLLSARALLSAQGANPVYNASNQVQGWPPRGDRTSERSATVASQRGAAALPSVSQPPPSPDFPPEWGKVFITYTPFNSRSSEASIGKGKGVGLWWIDVCNLSNAPVSIPKAVVTSASPSILAIPDGHRERFLADRTRRNPVVAVGSVFASYAPLAAGAIGLATSGVTMGAGLAFGVQALKHGIEDSRERLKAAGEEYKLYSPMPPFLDLAPMACGGYDVLSSAVYRPAKHYGRLGRE